MSSSRNSNKRLILLIVRKYEHGTNGDILYLFEQKIKYDLRKPEYEHNEILWEVNTKQDILPKKLNVNDAKYNILSISYHLHSETCRVYVYFNYFGQRILKRDIIKKMQILFENNKNKISHQVLKDF